MVHLPLCGDFCIFGVMVTDVKNIKPNPNNPRVIKDEKFRKLVKSIKDFPEMLQKRPLVCFTDIDGKYVVLGGNMRLKASIEVGLKELPIILADDWTQEQRAQFLIKDNVGFGEWDWEQLQSEWDIEQLEEWGLDVPSWNQSDETDYSEKNKEEDKMKMTFDFSSDEYTFVRDELSGINANKELAILKLLGYEQF